MRKLFIALICITCILLTGCQKKEKVVDLKNVSGDFENVSGENTKVENKIDDSITENVKERNIEVQKLKLNYSENGSFEHIVYEGQVNINGEKCDLKITTDDTDVKAGYYSPTCVLNIQNASRTLEGYNDFCVVDLDTSDNNIEIAALHCGEAYYNDLELFRYVNGEICCIGSFFPFENIDDLENVTIDNFNRINKEYCDLFEEKFLLTYYDLKENELQYNKVGRDFEVDADKLYTVKEECKVYDEFYDAWDEDSSKSIGNLSVGEKIKVLDISYDDDLMNQDRLKMKIEREDGKICVILYYFY